MAVPLRIKICGVTRPEDGRLAGLLGADAVGINFFPGSKRYVEPGAVEPILRALPPLVEAVGVFVGGRLREAVEAVGRFGRMRTVQIHGEKPAPEAAFPFHWVVAFAVRDQEGPGEITAYLERCRRAGALPDAVLVDGHAAGAYGGTGRMAPWEMLAEFRPGVPVVLAGGLTPENVAEAVRTVRPYAVDVAGGVESAPGRKDAAKMRRFIDSAREAAAGLAE